MIAPLQRGPAMRPRAVARPQQMPRHDACVESSSQRIICRLREARVSHRFPALALLAAAFALLAGPALARCSKNLVDRLGAGVQLASLDGVELAADPSTGQSGSRAIITFLGHASYQIDTPQGVRAITDYNGVNRFRRHPHIVPLNNS